VFSKITLINFIQHANLYLIISFLIFSILLLVSFSCNHKWGLKWFYELRIDVSVTLVITNDPITSPMYCAENTLYLSRRLVLRVMTTILKKLQYQRHSQFWIFCIYLLTAVLTNILTGHTPNLSSKPILKEIPYAINSFVC
jgi:hypothetical protein